MPLLPPVTQTFTINASAYLAGIDEMLAATDRLAESINVAAGSSERLAGASESVAGSESAVTDSISANAAAFERQSIAVDALVQESRALAVAVDEAAVAIDRENVALDATAASAGKADGMLAGVGSKGKMAFFAVAAAVGYAVVKAADFQSQITMLHTQAGVLSSQLVPLSHGVLLLASQVGFSPSSLAQALYHVESSFQSVGITAPKALELMKTAAEGARVGGANLVDVTNALDATIVSGVGGVKNYSQAMGVLNGIVGSGDMTMQNLAEAMGSGIMAVAKSFGQNIYQVGAALATFGDNNIRGAKAATDLRMSWQALLAPMKAGAGELTSIGLSSTALGHTLEHSGMTAAIQQFVTHLKASKVPVSDWGQYVTEIFGKRAGVGIGIMIDQLDRLKGKLPDLEKGAHGFGNAWASTQKTLSQQWHNLLGGIEALAVSFGTVLLPPVTKVLGKLAEFFGWLEKHPAFAAIAGGIIAVAAAMGGLSIAIGAVSTLLDPITLIAAAVVGLGVGIYEAYKHCAEFRSIIHDIASFFVGAWNSAMHIAGTVITWFTNGPLAFIKQQIGVFTKFWDQNHAEIMKIVKVAWDLITGYVKVGWDLISGYLRAGLDVLVGLFKTVWAIISAVVKMAWDIIATVIRAGVRIILDAISIFLDLLQGHWSAAWGKLKDLLATALHAALSIGKSILTGFVSVLVAIGKDLVMGLIHGVESMFGAVGNAVSDLGHHVVSVFKDVLHIFSPSQVFYELGTEITAGLGAGITETASKAEAAARQLAAKVWAAYKSGEITYSEANSLEARITTGLASKSNSLSKFLHDLGLSLNRVFMQGFSGTPAQVKSSVDKLLTDVKDAWDHGAISYQQAGSLTNFIENDNAKLEKLATQRATILKTIAAAQKYATSTASNVQSWASLSNAMSSVPAGGAITGAGLLASLQTDLATIRQFNAAIQKLAKLGLNKNLLNQIIQAGPTDGLTLAEALLSGPVSQIAQLNKTEQQITVASNQIGRTAANAMYDTGKYAGQGFLTGLKDQQKSIEDLMGKIADSMIKRLKKDLGIHSPSSVAHWHGMMFAQGLAQGIDDGKGLVDAAAGRLSGAMHVQMPYSAGFGGGASGGNTYKLDLTVKVDGLVVGSDPQLIRAITPAVQTAILQLENRNPTPQTARSRKAA